MPSLPPSLLHTHATYTAIEYIQHIHQEREGREREIEALKQEMEELNTAIVRCQEQLPASGAPITRQVCCNPGVLMVVCTN